MNQNGHKNGVYWILTIWKTHTPFSVIYCKIYDYSDHFWAQPIISSQSDKVKRTSPDDNSKIESVILTVNNLLLSLGYFLSHLPEDLLLDSLQITTTAADPIWNINIIITRLSVQGVDYKLSKQEYNLVNLISHVHEKMQNSMPLRKGRD